MLHIGEKIKQYQIRITELVEEDIENVGDFIVFELKNLFADENIVSGICAKINLPVNLPERNDLDEDGLFVGLSVRKDYYRNYKFYYVVEGTPFT